MPEVLNKGYQRAIFFPRSKHLKKRMSRKKSLDRGETPTDEEDNVDEEEDVMDEEEDTEIGTKVEVRSRE